MDGRDHQINIDVQMRIKKFNNFLFESVLTSEDKKKIEELVDNWLEDNEASSDKFYDEYNEERKWKGIVPKDKMEKALMYASSLIEEE